MESRVRHTVSVVRLLGPKAAKDAGIEVGSRALDNLYAERRIVDLEELRKVFITEGHKAIRERKL